MNLKQALYGIAEYAEDASTLLSTSQRDYVLTWDEEVYYSAAIKAISEMIRLTALVNLPENQGKEKILVMGQD